MPASVQKKPQENPVATHKVSAEGNVPGRVRRLTLKQVLYHPLTGLAIAAHLLLLVVPFNKPSPPPIAPEAPEESIDESIPVDILNLSALSKPKPPTPEPSAAAPLEPVAVPPAPVPAPAAAPVAAEEIAPAEPEPSPDEPLPPEDPLPSKDPLPSEDPLPSDDLPAYVAHADQRAFIDNIDVLGSGTRGGVGNYRALGLPDEDYFAKGNSTRFLNYATNPPGLIQGVIDAVWMDKQADLVAEQIDATYGANGVTLVPLAPYADELLYEMLTPNGDTIMYVSLINFPARGSSLMVTWEVNPLGR